MSICSISLGSYLKKKGVVLKSKIVLNCDYSKYSWLIIGFGIANQLSGLSNDNNIIIILIFFFFALMCLAFTCLDYPESDSPILLFNP